MEQIVPWAELQGLVEPHDPKGENGRPPVGLGIMLRMYFLQQVPPTPVTPPKARSVPSPRETAPASSSARTSRIPSALPEFAVAIAFAPRLKRYTLSLWIGEFFRGSLSQREPRTRVVGRDCNVAEFGRLLIEAG